MGSRVCGGWLALVVAVALSAAACVPVTSAIKPDHKRRLGSAYLYGRFAIDAESAFLNEDAYPSIEFLIKCRDGKNYKLRFSKHTPLQVIEVAPAKCQMDALLYVSGDGKILGAQSAEFRLLRNENLDAGGVYYVGDFVATAASDWSQRLLYTRWRYAFRLGEGFDDYATTTAELHRTFSGFDDARTENRTTRRPGLAAKAAANP